MIRFSPTEILPDRPLSQTRKLELEKPVREDLHCCLCPTVEFGITYGEAMVLGWEATKDGAWICPAHGETR